MLNRFRIWLGGSAPGRWVLILAAATFVMRFNLALRFLRTPYHEFTLHVSGPDQNRFLLWAEGIRAGHWEVPGTSAAAAFQFSPVYSFLLSLSLAFKTHPFHGILALQAFLSSLVICAFWDIGKRFGSRGAGLCAAVIWSLYAPAAYFDACLMRESLLASTGLLVFWAAVRAWDRPSFHGVVIAGSLLGFCSGLRPHIFLFVVPAVVFAAALHKRDARRLAAGIGIFLSACAFISPITYHNWKEAHRWVPVSTQGADALILGNDPDGPGVGFVPTPTSKSMLDRSRDTLGGAAGVIAAEFYAKPKAALELYGRKFRMLINDYEVPDNYSFYIWKWLSRPPAWLLLGWGAVFPFACLGFFAAVRGRSRWKLAAGGALVFMLGALAVHIQSRYRFVAAPFLVLLAGYALARLSCAAAERRWLRVVLPLGFVCVMGFLVRPLPSCGYHYVTGSDNVERLNRDEIREVDYVTLMASWMLSDRRGYADEISAASNQAYRSYGLAVAQQFDLSIRALSADLDRVLSQAYRKKYHITKSK